MKGSWKIDGFALRKFKFATREIRTKSKSLPKSECLRKLYLTEFYIFLNGLKVNCPII